MTEKIFVTTLINDRRVPVMAYELDGPLVELKPGQEYRLESCSPVTAFARWTTVRWRQDGSVAFIARPNFVEPDRGRWTIRLLNESGHAVEERLIGGQPVVLPRGIPVLIGLKLDDPLVRYRSLTILTQEILVKDEERAGYLAHDTIKTDETELRDEDELRALDMLLAEKA